MDYNYIPTSSNLEDFIKIGKNIYSPKLNDRINQIYNCV